jgi:hypothetical protein
MKLTVFCALLGAVALLCAYVLYVEWRCFLNAISIAPNLIRP